MSEVTGVSNSIQNLTAPLTLAEKNSMIAVIKDDNGNVKRVVVNSGYWFSRLWTMISLIMDEGYNNVTFGKTNLINELTPLMHELRESLSPSALNSKSIAEIKESKQLLKTTISYVSRVNTLFETTHLSPHAPDTGEFPQIQRSKWAGNGQITPDSEER